MVLPLYPLIAVGGNTIKEMGKMCPEKETEGLGHVTEAKSGKGKVFGMDGAVKSSPLCKDVPGTIGWEVPRAYMKEQSETKGSGSGRRVKDVIRGQPPRWRQRRSALSPQCRPPILHYAAISSFSCRRLLSERAQRSHPSRDHAWRGRDKSLLNDHNMSRNYFGSSICYKQ